MPIGFVSDHIEVLYDLDTEAAELCDKLGIAMQRAATAGTHPRFVTMIRELIQERVRNSPRASHAGHDGAPTTTFAPRTAVSTRPRRPPTIS